MAMTKATKITDTKGKDPVTMQDRKKDFLKETGANPATRFNPKKTKGSDASYGGKGYDWLEPNTTNDKSRFKGKK